MTTYFLIPGYNCEAYVQRCVDSIMKQQGDWVAVFVNDASTDGTTDVLNKIQNKDRIAVVNIHENRGPAHSRWAGMEFIKCVATDEDVVACVDMDDYLLTDDIPLRLEKIYRKADVELTLGGMRYLNWKRDEPRQYPTDVINSKAFRASGWRAWHLRTFRVGLWNRCFGAEDGRQYFQFEGGEWYRVCTDVAMLHPMLEQCQSFRYITDTVYGYNDGQPLGGGRAYGRDLHKFTNEHINKRHKQLYALSGKPVYWEG